MLSLQELLEHFRAYLPGSVEVLLNDVEANRCFLGKL